MGKSCCGFKQDSSCGQLISEHELIQGAAKTGRNLTEPEAYQVMEDYGIPIPSFGVAKNPEEAVRVSMSIGYPVVMKVVSPDVLHKSDVGGVRLGLTSEEAVQRAYEDIMCSVIRKEPGAKIDGILIAKAADKSVGCTGDVDCSDVLEVIIGAVRDPEFGHAVMFGLGGIFVEIARDVVFRITPVTHEDAFAMMSEIKAGHILEGVRGRAPRDKDALADIIVAVSRLVQENPSIASVDLNPVLCFGRGACAVDAKITC
jgi:acetyl-CoA synthetase (ADP-forming)